MAQPTHRYILQWSREIAPGVKHLGMTREDEKHLPFIAGQFLTLHIFDPNRSKILHRSYSIANAPESNILEIACAYVQGGVASNFLFSLKPGDIIDASGPYGLFILKDEQPKRYILVATGTGITPYRSMLVELRNRLQARPESKVIIVQGVRKSDELLFGQEFVDTSKSHPNFHFYACYSRGNNIEHAYERKGHVQDTFEELNLNPAEDIIYLCGNPNMIDDAFAVLTQKGFDRHNIRREKYVFSH